MKRILILICAVILFAACRDSAKKDITSIMFDDTVLEDARQAVNSGEPVAVEAFEALRAAADTLYMTMEPLSVTMKKVLPPSKDLRDYMTLSPYWWADPDSPDGLPYIRRDGDRNPEVYDYPERVNSGVFGDAVQTLAMVYYVTGEEKYAAKAAEMLRVWFLDPQTGINPNMMFAQIRPGHDTIRGTGIIDSRRFVFALDGAKMIEGSQAWTDDDKAQLRAWTGAFIYWLENSTYGRMEHRAANNHGMWYDAIHLLAVMYTGDYDYAAHVLETSYAPRLGTQIAEDGSMPHELARTLGLHYTTFALEAAMIAARVGEKTGFDLWGYTAPNGRNLKQAVEYAYPYYVGEQQWPHIQISKFETHRGAAVLYEAGQATGDSRYVDAARSVSYDAKERLLQSFLYWRLNASE